MLEGFLSLLGIYKLYEKWLLFQLGKGTRPEHVAIILDGNRRWAAHKALIPWIGHRHGADKMDDLMDWCLELDVKIITLYAFSTENFNRPQKEVEAIMKLIEEKLSSILENERIHENRIMDRQDADLIIRTSGEERLSGFLSWQSAYSELCFVDVNWPDFRKIDLLRAVRTYQRRKRRFGK
ncbi:MAG: undecaprenyl diphosphate synthase family protein [Candidatus Bathyarchaeota archaeon]